MKGPIVITVKTGGLHNIGLCVCRYFTAMNQMIFSKTHDKA